MQEYETQVCDLSETCKCRDCYPHDRTVHRAVSGPADMEYLINWHDPHIWAITTGDNSNRMRATSVQLAITTFEASGRDAADLVVQSHELGW